MGGDPMTATYDGKLSVNVKSKSVGACCRAMDEAAMRGQFYVGQKGQLMLRRSDRPTGGQTCVCCPFCGARVNEPVPSEGGFILPDPTRPIQIGDSEERSE